MESGTLAKGATLRRSLRVACRRRENIGTKIHGYTKRASTIAIWH